MSIAATVRALVIAGCTPEQISAAVDAWEAAQNEGAQKRRARDAERKRAYRAAAPVVSVVAGDAVSHVEMSQMSHVVPGTLRDTNSVSPLSSPPSLPPTPPNPSPPIIPPSHKITGAGARAPVSPKAADHRKSPADELSGSIGDELAREVIAHRSRLKKPLTAFAAQMLAKRFAAAPDPRAAARMMIERGWQGYHVDWEKSQSTGPPHSRNSRPGFGDLMRENLDEQSHHHESGASARADLGESVGLRGGADPPGRGVVVDLRPSGSGWG